MSTDICIRFVYYELGAGMMMVIGDEGPPMLGREMSVDVYMELVMWCIIIMCRIRCVGRGEFVFLGF